MNGLDKYLKKKHLEDCLEMGLVLNESEWVKEVLNKRLPPGEKLAYPSVNQWMNGDRPPDVNNIKKLIKVFGPEIIPYVGIELPADLARLVQDWDHLPDNIQEEITNLAKNNLNPKGEVALLVAA